MAFTMLICVANLQKSDKVFSISQIYLTGGPFFQGEPINISQNRCCSEHSWGSDGLMDVKDPFWFSSYLNNFSFRIPPPSCGSCRLVNNWWGRETSAHSRALSKYGSELPTRLELLLNQCSTPSCNVAEGAGWLCPLHLDVLFVGGETLDDETNDLWL